MSYSHMYKHQCDAHWPSSGQDSGDCVCAVCGLDTAQRGENSFTVSCTYTPYGVVETAAECDAACTAAGASHCSFGWFNGSSCFAFTATCPGDCVLTRTNRAMISWRTCREAGDPVMPRVCASEEPRGGGVQGALPALTCACTSVSVTKHDLVSVSGPCVSDNYSQCVLRCTCAGVLRELGFCLQQCAELGVVWFIRLDCCRLRRCFLQP